MVDEALDDNIGIDLESELKNDADEFDNSLRDLSEETKKAKEKPSWLETIGDVFTQAGLGALKVLTWPADVIKLGMIGEGLNDIDELEEAYKRAGKPFDRKKYIKDVFETAQFIPTQELGEKGFEEVTGISLEPKTELGNRARQAAAVFGFTPGGVAKKATSAAVAAGTTEALKFAGVGEGKAEVIGDIASLGPQLIEKGARKLTPVAQQMEKTAKKHALPFLEYMVKEREPILRGKLFRNTEERLKNEFNISSSEALQRIVENDLPIAKLRNRGVNLDALGEHAYAVTEQLAQAKPSIINTQEIVKNIDAEIGRIKKLAPAPSDAQKTALGILEEQRDIMKVSNPSPQQLIAQHKNYNADVKAIYKKPEFSGKEEEVRKTYEFLKDQLLHAMEKQGSKDVANSFRAANKIYHEKSKLIQTENILSKAFSGDEYSPKKLDKLLNSKQGNYLKRNLGEQAIRDIEEIAKYGKDAQQKMVKFLELQNPQVAKAAKEWGPLAPFLVIPNMKGKFLAFAKPVAERIQGYLLTRPATREMYKITLKHASEGSFNLLKKDFLQLERQIGKEWGSLDNFMDSVMEELEIFDSNKD